MADTKHTPGPWIAIIPLSETSYNGNNITDFTVYTEKTRGDFNEEGRRYKQDTYKVDNIKIAGGYQYDLPLDELQANARLIAASPELLELLKKTRATISFEFCTEDGNHYLDLLNEIDSAVDKAEGKEA